jgi:hypothetical protein
VFAHAGDVERRRELQQPLCVDPVLQTSVGHAQDFHCEQLLCAGHWDRTGWAEVDRRGSVDNLLLDAGTGEQQIYLPSKET